MTDFRNKLRKSLELYAKEIEAYIENLTDEKWYEKELFRPNLWKLPE